MAAAKKPPPIVVVRGNDLFVLEELIQRAVAKCGGPESCECHRFDAAQGELSQALETAISPSLLSPELVIAITHLEKVDVKQLPRLQRYLENPEPTVKMILQVKAGRSIKKDLLRLIEECHTVDPKKERAKAIERAIGQVAAEYEVEFDRGALAYLREAFSKEEETCRMELEKLALYAGADGKVTGETCRELLVAKTDEAVWNIGGAVGKCDAAQALRVLHDLLAQGHEPLPILGILQSLYRNLWLVKQLELRKVPRARWTEATGVQAWALKRAGEQAKKLTLERITDGLGQLTRADEELKGASRWKELVLERLVVRLASG